MAPRLLNLALQRDVWTAKLRSGTVSTTGMARVLAGNFVAGGGADSAAAGSADGGGGFGKNLISMICQPISTIVESSRAAMNRLSIESGSN
jgi:hypothetical protein